MASLIRSSLDEIASALENQCLELTCVTLPPMSTLTIDGARKLAAPLAYNRVATELNLAHGHVNDDQLEVFARSLQTNTTLCSLSIADNNISSKGILELARCLSTGKTPLKSLHVNLNIIGSLGAGYLARAFYSSVQGTLQTLSIANCSIGDEGAGHIAQWLAIDFALNNLDLGGNRITSRGCAYLAQALLQNNTLASLDLRTNAVGDHGSAYLGECLEANTSLTELNLRTNAITDTGCSYIAEALQKNVGLTMLNLLNNPISVDGAECLSAALKANSQIRQLWFVLDGPGLGVRTRLDESLRLNADNLPRRQVTLLSLLLAELPSRM